MLEFYIISTFISFLITIINNKSYNDKKLNEGVIFKRNNMSTGAFVLAMIFSLLPFVNIVASLIDILIKNKSLKSGDSLPGGALYLPKFIKYIYEGKNIDNKTLTDAMILDGADEQVIKNELRKVIDVEGVFNCKGGYADYFFDTTFTEADYNLANAQIYAKEFLDEIECHTKLTEQERNQLLGKLRRVYLAEIKGKKSEDISPITELEKILARKAS